MKTKHRYTSLILLILTLSGLFGIATAAHAQKVHALLICLGDDLNIRASVNVNEEKMTALLLQVSESCNVNLTIMKSVKVGRGVVTKMTFANGNTIRASDQEQGLITTDQVVQWLEKLRPEADDTLLVYYNGHGAVYGKTHMLHFDEVRQDLYNRNELKEMLAQKQARLKMLITDTCKNRVDTPPPNVDKYAQPRAKNRRYTDHLFLQHEGMLDITAASTNQFALANDQLGGFFTAALIESFSEEADTKIKGGVGDNDGFLSWQEVFAKCVWETQNLFSQSESDFDSALSKDLDEKEQTTQTPEQFSLPTRIGSDSDSVPLQPPKSIPSTAILNFTSVPFGGGGGSVPPQTPMIGATLQNADNAFDDAETTEVHDDPEKMEKYRQKQQELYDKAMTLYSEVIERDTKGKYAQRAHYQIAKIYKRRYDWDKANEHYQAIVALDPTGYYANEAKSGTANIRKNSEVIKVKRAEYQNYKAIYDTEPTDETFNIAAEALYEVARAYESLENYTEAIRHYERLVEEFPEHAKAPQAQFQTGNVYFYTLYDYQGGWPAFVGVTQKFPDSYEASQAKTLLKQTIEILTEIKFLMDEIDKYRNKKAVEYRKTGRKITPADMWVMGYSDQVVHNFQQIAGNWEKLHNSPRAINAYKTLARDLSHKKFAAADARYRIGALYQQNGEYERAIEAYDNLFENASESVWRNEAVYQQAVCYRSIREFGSAYEGFKAYMSITRGEAPYRRETEQIVRQYELDQDEDGYKFYEEQEAGTSDQDANSHPDIGD